MHCMTCPAEIMPCYSMLVLMLVAPLLMSAGDVAAPCECACVLLYPLNLT